MVKRRRLELPRRNWHYPLKVARLPIPPPLHQIFWITCEEKRVPRTGLEPARLAAHAPETCASTNSATWALFITNLIRNALFCSISERKTGLGPATPTLARLCSTNWAISACFISFRRASLSIADAKVQQFSELPKLFVDFFKKNIVFCLQNTFENGYTLLYISSLSTSLWCPGIITWWLPMGSLRK